MHKREANSPTYSFFLKLAVLGGAGHFTLSTLRRETFTQVGYIRLVLAPLHIFCGARYRKYKSYTNTVI